MTWQRPQWRSVRIPLRVIESVYGRGNFDDAGDDIIHAVRTVSAYPDQFRCKFGNDLSHPNPWYHAMTCEIEDIPAPEFERFVARLTDLGIRPE